MTVENVDEYDFGEESEDTSEAQDLDAAAGDTEGGYDVAGIIAAIDGGISTWMDAFVDIFNNMARPGVMVGEIPGGCYAVQHYNQWLIESYRITLVNAGALALRAAELGHETVDDVVRTYGRPEGSGGVKALNKVPFAEVIMQETTLDSAAGILAIFLGPMGIFSAAAILDWIDDRLPQWVDGELPPSSNRGVQVNPGWYLWAGPGRTPAQHWEFGKWTGTEFRRAFLNWRTNMRSEVVPGQHNQWRDLLFGLTGRSRDDWRIWLPGDPYQVDSKMWKLLDVKEYVDEEIALSRVLCAEATEFQQQTITRTLDIQEGAAQTTGIATLLTSSTGPLAVLAGALVGMTAAGKL